MYRALVNFLDLDLNGNLGERDIGTIVTAEEFFHENFIFVVVNYRGWQRTGNEFDL